MERKRQAEEFATWSGLKLEPFYEGGAEDELERRRKLGTPGSFPFTRGIFAQGYRSKRWITRNLTGLVSPQVSNERLKYLRERGQTGLALVPDMPTQLGLDSDHPMALASVGTQGVPLSSVADMEALFDGIGLDGVTASFSIPGTSAPVVMAQYVLAARRRGIPLDRVRGSIQNDPIQARFCCYDAGTPLELALRVAIDTVEYSVRNLPNWHPLTVNAYDLRESGINAIQEMGFALAIAFAYIDELLGRGLTVDDFAHRILLICGVHIDIFEEAAKFRAARRIWAHRLKDHYGARLDRSIALKLAAHGCGSSLTSQQPVNNVVRAAYEALAAVLGGVQALDLSCYDEGLRVPSREAAAIALKTQEILAVETGVTSTVDPLGGSYFFESLTDRMEEEIAALIGEIESRGGMKRVVESGWFGDQLSASSRQLCEDIDTGRRQVVGVNVSVGGQPEDLLPTKNVHLAPSVEQVERVRNFKLSRDLKAVETALSALRLSAESRGENLFPAIMAASAAGATIGEIVGTMRIAYGATYDPFGMIECPFALSQGKR